MKRARPGDQLAVDELASLNREFSQLIAFLDGDLALARAVRLLTEEFGFHCAWIAERANTDGAVIGYTSGIRTDRVAGLTLRNGCGLGGKVFAEGRIAWVNDYLRSSDITHEYDGAVAGEHIQCMIAAPLGNAPHPLGVLLAGLRADGDFGDRGAAIVETVADRTVQALLAADRARRAIEIAVYEERQRLATDLQDSLGPVLSGDAAQRLRDALRRMRAPLPNGEERRGHGLRAPVAAREHDVLRRVAAGETNAQIATTMNLSLNTVKTYLRNAMRKLGARNRVEAVARAREAGLL